MAASTEHLAEADKSDVDISSNLAFFFPPN